MSTQTNQPIDPALRDHLAELAYFAAEIGAFATFTVRLPKMARLFIDIGEGLELYPLAGVGAPNSGDQGECVRLIVVSLFAASDGGAPGTFESP